MVHIPESAAVVVFSSASSECPEEPYVTVYSNYPTLAPSEIPSLLPSFLPTPFAQSNKDPHKKNSELLLAIILPIIILAVVAIVGLVARAYLVAGKGDMIPLSEDSGSDLIFDT
jgi:Na+/proline symporter